MNNLFNFYSILSFLKRLWKCIKSLFKKKNRVKITVLLFLFLSLSTAFSQRTNLQYVLAFFHQDSIENVQFYTVYWSNGLTDSLDIFLSDTANTKVWFNNNWIPYQSGIVVDSVRLQVNKIIDFNVEYTFRVVAKNQAGEATSSPVLVYFIVSDINQSYSVDGVDLIRLAKKWGYTGMGYRDFEDITGDGFVDGLDLIQMSRDWGKIWIP